VAYVPQGLFVAVTHLDRAKTPVDNAHDHVTLMLAGFAAKQSNDVLEGLFADGQLLAAKQALFAELPAQAVVQAAVAVGKTKHRAFLVKLAAPLQWSGVTRKMY
jgi:hypothetical protein